jgi:hypothetical protein
MREAKLTTIVLAGDKNSLRNKTLFHFLSYRFGQKKARQFHFFYRTGIAAVAFSLTLNPVQGCRFLSVVVTQGFNKSGF